MERAGLQRIGCDWPRCRVNSGQRVIGRRDGKSEQGISILAAQHGMNERLRCNLVGDKVGFRRSLELGCLLNAVYTRAELAAQKRVDLRMRIDDGWRGRNPRQRRRRRHIGAQGRADRTTGGQNADIQALDAQSNTPSRPRFGAHFIAPHVSTPLLSRDHPGLEMGAFDDAQAAPKCTV